MSRGSHSRPRPLLVIGLGSVLRRDDGVGVHLVRALARENWPPSVRIVEAGTPGLALVDFLEGAGRVVLIDACELGSAPGTVRIFSPEEVRARSEDAPLSVHQADVLGALRLARAVGLEVPVTLVGVQPGSLEPGTELSPHLAAALPEVLTRIRNLLRSLLSAAPSSPPGAGAPAQPGG